MTKQQAPWPGKLPARPVPAATPASPNAAFRAAPVAPRAAVLQRARAQVTAPSAWTPPKQLPRLAVPAAAAIQRSTGAATGVFRSPSVKPTGPSLATPVKPGGVKTPRTNGLRAGGSLNGGANKVSGPRTQVVQRMITSATGNWGGGPSGSGGGDRPPDRWHPDDTVRKLMNIPRGKLSGGNHFIPANWIDRMLAVAVMTARTVGRVQELMSELHDLVGNDAPLEISNKLYTDSSSSLSPYTSRSDSSETGLVQVFENLRERLREWPENIFPSDLEHSGDGGGRMIDMPLNADAGTVTRIANAAGRLIHLFDRWCGATTVEVPMPAGSSQTSNWHQLRSHIQVAIVAMALRASFGPGNYSSNHHFI